MSVQIPIDREIVAAFCRRHHIRKLALFGSVLRDDFGPDSDVDVLVEFDPDHVPSFFRLFDMERELSGLVGGHKIEMVTYRAINRRLRDRVIASSEVQYVEG